jgi:hypothetical protein
MAIPDLIVEVKPTRRRRQPVLAPRTFGDAPHAAVLLRRAR